MFAGMDKLASWGPYLHSVLRIVAGFTFTLHGVQKTFGWLGGMGGHPAELGSLLGVAGLLETIGGPLILLGLFTRPTAFILSGEMAVGYFRVHLTLRFWPLFS